jgi:hypothetical protein
MMVQIRLVILIILLKKQHFYIYIRTCTERLLFSYGTRFSTSQTVKNFYAKVHILLAVAVQITFLLIAWIKYNSSICLKMQLGICGVERRASLSA